MGAVTDEKAALRPLPQPDELTARFWKAANEHRLAIQRCGQCGRWNHAPTLLCPACGSGKLEFEHVSGRARLYSWTVIHDAPAPGFANLLPLIVGLVELEEQQGLILATNIVDTDLSSLRVDLPLAVIFADITEDVTLPNFTAARG